MFHVKIQNTREKGALAEKLASDWLIKQGFLIKNQNYLKKYGEIDIVATKSHKIHFIEVKSVYSDRGRFRPEENVHEIKQKRLRRVIQAYLSEKGGGLDKPFEFHVLTVETSSGKINLLENIIL